MKRACSLTLLLLLAVVFDVDGSRHVQDVIASAASYGPGANASSSKRAASNDALDQRPTAGRTMRVAKVPIAPAFLTMRDDECSCSFSNTCSCDTSLDFMDCIVSQCSSGQCNCEGSRHFLDACKAMSASCPHTQLVCTSEAATCAEQVVRFAETSDARTSYDPRVARDVREEGRRQRHETEARDQLIDPVSIVDQIDWMWWAQWSSFIVLVAGFGIYCCWFFFLIRSGRGVASIACTTALLFLTCEMYFHSKCGHIGDGMTQQEACSGLSGLASLLAFCEAVCQAGMSVALGGFLWDFVVASSSGKLSSFVQTVFVGDDDLRLSVAGLAFAAFFIGFALRAEHHPDQAFSERSALYLQAFESFCSAVILCALMGMLLGFVTSLASDSVAHGAADSFLWNLLVCVDSREKGVADEKAQVEAPNWPKAALLWILFLGTFVYSYLSEPPAAIGYVLGVWKIMCFGGIAMFVFSGLVHFQRTVLSLTTGRSLATLGTTKV